MYDYDKFNYSEPVGASVTYTLVGINDPTQKLSVHFTGIDSYAAPQSFLVYGSALETFYAGMRIDHATTTTIERYDFSNLTRLEGSAS